MPPGDAGTQPLPENTAVEAALLLPFIMALKSPAVLMISDENCA